MKPSSASLLSTPNSRIRRILSFSNKVPTINPMALTLREVLEISPLDQSKVIAGAGGLDREVTYTSVMEVPNYIEMARDGELLLTTCYSIRNNPPMLAKLLPLAHARGLAGLAIKPRYLNPIPEVMIKCSNDLDLPLMKFPLEIRFDDAIIPVLTRILNEKAYLLGYSLEMHRRFTEIALGEGGMPRIAAALSTLIQNPVAIVDAEFNLVVQAPLAGMDEFFVAHLVSVPGGKRLKIKKNRLEDIRRLKPSMRIDLNILRSAPRVEQEPILQPIGLGDDPYGYLVIWEYSRQLVPADCRTIEQAAIVAALEMAKQRAIAQVESRHLIDFVHELVTDQIPSNEAVIQRAKLVGWDLSDPHVIMIFDIDDFQRRLLEEPKIARPQRLLERMERISSHIASLLDDRFKMCRIADSVILFLPIDLSNSKEERKRRLIRLARRFAVELNDALDGVEVSIGIGRAQPHPADLSRSHSQAFEALAIGRQVLSKDHVYHFDDLGIYRLLSPLREGAEARSFTEEVLGPLISRDKKRGGKLLITLEAFLDNNQEMKRTAEALHIHYNTLRYRLERIEKLIGPFRKDPWLRLGVQVAVRLRPILER